MSRNGLGISGIASGMDTESMIAKIMKYSKKPLDRLKQKQQKLIWKQEAYRTQNTALSQLKNLVFDLKLQQSYNTKSTTTTNAQIVTATAKTGAVNGNYSIKVQQLATTATNFSNTPVSVRSQVKGDSLELSPSNQINIGSGNNQFTITVDGVTQTITLADGTYDGTEGKTLADLAKNIQNQLTGLSTPVYVKANSDNQLVFYTGQNDDSTAHTIVLGAVDSSLSALGFGDGANTKELTGGIITSTVTVNSSNNKFKITLGNGTAQEITLSETTYGTYDPTVAGSLDTFASNIETQIRNLGGDYTKVKVTVDELNRLKIYYTDSADPANPLSIKLESSSSQDVLSEMGFTSGAMSEYPQDTISTSTSFWNQRDKFIDSEFFSGKSETSFFKFTINGQDFQFSNKATLDDVIKAINSNSAAGVTAYYDSFSDKLTLTTKETGNNNTSGSEIRITDTDGFLGQLFHIDPANEKGGDNAIVTINGVQTQRQSNTFTMNNIDFTLTGETGSGSATMVNVSTDTSGIVDKISKFVDKYNEIIAAINGEISETRATAGSKYTYYEPLTDEQKEEMSEDEISTWNEKAKQGLLHSDDILSSALYQMRSSLSRQVNTPLTLTGIAIPGTIDLTGSSRFSITVGNDTREIKLNDGTYTSEALVNDMQKKLDIAFGTGRVKVALKNNAITLTSNNSAMTINSASQSNGLSLLGFSNGQSVKSTYSSLSQIGITTSSDYTEKGKLSLDKDKLAAALAEDPDAVMRLFVNNETITVDDDADSAEIANAKQLEKDRQGIFYNLFDIISTQISKITKEAGTTGTALSTNELGQDLIDIAKQMETVQDRIDAEEDRLWNLFNLMESYISQMSVQSEWISSMLGTSNNK